MFQEYLETYVRVFKDVSKVFQECLESFVRVLKEYFKSDLRVLQHCFKSASKVICGVSGVFLKCLKNALIKEYFKYVS